MISNNEINFPHELLLTDRQVSSRPQSFANLQLILSYEKPNYQR